MITPFDWQEAIGHRAQFVEARLEQGAPVLAASLNEGILMLTYRRQARKIYEIYDRLAYGAIGQQSDVENLRMGAIEFAHMEGYNRSTRDVTIQRVISALSSPLKKTFSDFASAPVVARSFFAQVCETIPGDRYYILDYDGDYQERTHYGFVAGSTHGAERINKQMKSLRFRQMSVQVAREALRDAWALGMEDGERSVKELTRGLTEEVVLLERNPKGANRFRIEL